MDVAVRHYSTVCDHPWVAVRQCSAVGLKLRYLRSYIAVVRHCSAMRDCPLADARRCPVLVVGLRLRYLGKYTPMHPNVDLLENCNSSNPEVELETISCKLDIWLRVDTNRGEPHHEKPRIRCAERVLPRLGGV